MKKIIIIIVLLLGIVILVPAQKIINRGNYFQISEIPAADLPSYQKLSDALHAVVIYQKMVRERIEASPQFFTGKVKEYGEIKKVKESSAKIKSEKFCRYSSAKALQCATADFDKALAECTNNRVGFYMKWRKYNALDKLSRAEKEDFEKIERAVREISL